MQKMITIIPSKTETAKYEGKKRKKRVAAYLRVSSSSTEQEDSLDNMYKHFSNLLRDNPEWINAGIYIDDGISGLSTNKRDGFKAMMAAAKAHKIDMILVKSISRFARNTVTTLESIRLLNSYGTTVLFQKENLISTDPQTEFILSIMASMAQQESLSISQNTTLGFQYKMARGEHTLAYGSFLGYDRGPNGRLMVNPEQAETVRRIFELFLSGLTLTEVTKKLEEEGRKTGTGNPGWSKTGIRRILLNEKYCGDALLQKTYTRDVINKKRSKNEGQRKSYYIEGDHEPIIDRQTWYLARGELKRRCNQYFGESEPGIAVRAKKNDFTSKVVCPKCGAYLTRINTRKTYSWRCGNRVFHKCDFEIIKEEELMDTVLKAAQELWDKKPEIKMKEVPILSQDDPDERMIEAAAVNNENAFAKRTMKLINGSRPQQYYPDLVRYHIDRVDISDNEYIIRFYGGQGIRVARQTKKGRRKNIRLQT